MVYWDEVLKKPEYYYSHRLTTAHRHVNRVLGWIMQTNIPVDKKEINIAIQYLKDAGDLMNKAETILYKHMF